MTIEYNRHGSCLFRFAEASLSQIIIVVLLTLWTKPRGLIIIYLWSNVHAQRESQYPCFGMGCSGCE